MFCQSFLTRLTHCIYFSLISVELPQPHASSLLICPLLGWFQGPYSRRLVPAKEIVQGESRGKQLTCNMPSWSASLPYMYINEIISFAFHFPFLKRLELNEILFVVLVSPLLVVTVLCVQCSLRVPKPVFTFVGLAQCMWPTVPSTLPQLPRCSIYVALGSLNQGLDHYSNVQKCAPLLHEHSTYEKELNCSFWNTNSS